ncbi:MAG: hypothetical protein C7B44_14655 [Sulfobacillus thermosulfidooxidans]|nr:MAG: hypothetical protein C7B44_14655 [Sulfobacillus thermosulfidooxidans]
MMINHQRVMRIGMIFAVAGVLAGCGVTQAAHRTIQDIAALQSGAQYGANGQPINRAALQKSYGKYFPNLVITAAAIGAPAQPPFSLSAYPANGSIAWGPADRQFRLTRSPLGSKLPMRMRRPGSWRIRAMILRKLSAGGIRQRILL